jgi:hypothetical protein
MAMEVSASARQEIIDPCHARDCNIDHAGRESPIRLSESRSSETGLCLFVKTKLR